MSQMVRWIKPFTVAVLVLTALIVYLFVEAPPPLAEASSHGKMVSVEDALTLCNAENSIVRALYTQEIVGHGKQVGLAFDERWRQRDVDAGPLPALFLRETAMSLEKNPVRLGLFLGSDQPIRSANLFQGEQQTMFEGIRLDGEPRFFAIADTGLNTAMFADVAVAGACVSCHNAHAESPKSDWQLGDVMGATTWTYPRQQVDVEELFAMLDALRHGFRAAYSEYLEEVASFPEPPEIGDRWPRDGYYLPSLEVFMAEVARRASPQTLETLLASSSAPAPAAGREG